MKKNGILVKGLCHDRDGSSLKVVHEFWEDAVEYNDPGHIANNFRKAIIRLKKQSPELKNMGETCLKSFLWCIKHCEGNPETFEMLMVQQYNHFTGLDHSKCTHNANYKPKSWNYVEEESARQHLWMEFEKIIKRKEQYMEDYDSQKCEAFHNIR